MKILHLIYTNGIAGAEKYLRHLLPPLGDHGIECHLILVCAPGYDVPLQAYCSDTVNSGIPCKLIISSRRGYLSTARSIAGYMKDNSIKYIHSHLLNSDVLATMVKTIFYNKAIIISTKHGYKESILKQIPDSKNISALRKESRREIYYYVTRFVIRHAGYNYAVSKAISDLYFDLGLTKDRMPFIHHGVSIKDSVHPAEIAYRYSENQLIIVGRLEEFKGHRYLIEAMPDIIKQVPDVNLLIIGEGSQEMDLKELCNRLGIMSSVRFMGFNSDPYSYVKNSDVIILPSLFEPFGLVFIEAFALRTPVIAFNTPAGNEIMQNDETAILVTARDSKALAEKILLLLKNKGFAAELAGRAYNKYQASFTTDRMVRDTALFYKSLE